jgi:hypothetical protein
LSGPLYREEQRFRQTWVLVLVLGIAGLTWWIFVRQIWLGQTVGENALPDWGVWLMWILIGVVLPVFFLRTRLVFEVTSEQILIRFFPLMRRVILLSDVRTVEVRTYNAVKEYGGWGIKGWTGSNVAYNVSGSTGVQLTLRDDRRVMLGSQRAEELAAVIEAQRRDDVVGE